MSMSFGRSRLGLILAAAMVGLREVPSIATPFNAGLLRGTGRSARRNSRRSIHTPHQGKREIARRKVQMLRIELNKVCKQATENPLDMGRVEYRGFEYLGYDDAMQELDDQIRELMPLAYGRKTHNAPRRAWRIAGFGPQFKASSRAPLKRNFYVRNFGYPIVLQEGGAV